MGFAKYQEAVDILPGTLNNLKNHNSHITKTSLRRAVLARLMSLRTLLRMPKVRSKSVNTLQLRHSVLDIAVEEYRMREVFMNNIVYRLNPIDIPRFESRYRYFSKEVERAVNNAGFRLLVYTLSQLRTVTVADEPVSVVNVVRG
jgi:ppGpp synthetase/RelA/SpoT-type nucleotidyltranferase